MCSRFWPEMDSSRQYFPLVTGDYSWSSCFVLPLHHLRHLSSSFSSLIAVLLSSYSCILMPCHSRFKKRAWHARYTPLQECFQQFLMLLMCSLLGYRPRLGITSRRRPLIFLHQISDTYGLIHSWDCGLSQYLIRIEYIDFLIDYIMLNIFSLLLDCKYIFNQLVIEVNNAKKQSDLYLDQME